MDTKKYITYLSLTLLSIFLCSCKQGKASSKNSSIQQDTIKAITMPTIPPMLTTPEQRVDFLAKHYWDNVNFSDTTLLHRTEIMEQAWVDYCDVLKYAPLATAQQAIRATIDRMNVEKKTFIHFTNLADKYLYEPNSPMRNEEFYIPVLEAMIASSVLDDIEKIRPEARLKLAQNNRIGTKALNFTYTQASGTQESLYQLSTEYTLLFINNPGCHACAQTIAELKAAPTVNHLLQAKKLTILSLYPDEEQEEWENHLKDFPKEWINGYDKRLTIKEKGLYDLRAIPSLYLLNKDKKVLLKDATLPTIEAYLAAHP